MPDWAVLEGDCREVLSQIADDQFDCLISDPPAGIDFMGLDWDCFRRKRNPNDVGRENVFGRTSEHAPHSYGESDRGAFIAAMVACFTEAFRTLKPGAWGAVWALPRTSHWTATALEDAGFEVRDVIHHVFSTGFPKSLNVGAAIDKNLGAEREVIGHGRSGGGRIAMESGCCHGSADLAGDYPVTAAATDEAKRWDGWGTALKPACEHWILVRKPLSEKNVAENVLKHGTGAINIRAAEVKRSAGDVPGWHTSGANGSEGYNGTDTFKIRDMSAEEIAERRGDKGRWPADVVLSHSDECRNHLIQSQNGELIGATWTCAEGCPVAQIDQEGGQSKSRRALMEAGPAVAGWGALHKRKPAVRGHDDEGGASRYFPIMRYCPKPSAREKEAGCEQLPVQILRRTNPGGIENDPKWAPRERKNAHPTVKPLSLMRWLARLLCPPDGVILDPFAGSGTTGCAAVSENFGFVGVEMDANNVTVAHARIAHWAAEQEKNDE